MTNSSGSLHPGTLARIRLLLENALERRQFSGAAWAIVRGGGIEASGAVGTDGSTANQPVTLDSLFDAASLTKPVATAASALYLLDRGELLLGDEVGNYFPEAGSRWEGVTLRHLLTHTSGLPPYAAFHENTRGGEALREKILHLGPRNKPGEKYDYSCLGYILMQHLLQKVVGEGLDRFSRRVIFEPLGMVSSGYLPGAELSGRIVACSECPHRKTLLRGDVHDPLAWAGAGVSGNAGLFTSVNDLCRFAAMLLAQGAGPGNRVLSPASAGLMLRSQIDPSVGAHSIGFFTFPNEMLPRGELLPKSTVGHTGFTGTSLVVSPERDVAAVLLTNCLYYGPDKSDFFRTRRTFHTLVGAALEA